MASLKDQEKLPFGVLSQKQLDRKYCFVLSVEPTLFENKNFREWLGDDCDNTKQLHIKQQLHYELLENADGSVDLELETGAYQTFSQLLYHNPAIVAKSGFIDNVVEQLMEGLEQLHAQKIYQLCLSPQNLFIRKSDEMPMMLLHGSSFPVPFLLENVFADSEAYIAPELLEGQEMSPRSDIFSLGCFIKRLYDQGSVPFEYKELILKATKSDPQKRYESIEKMRADLKRRRSLKNSFFSFVGAMLVVLVCLFLYVELMPQAEDVEFIEPAPKEVEDPLVDGAFNPDDYIDPEILTDSAILNSDTIEQRKVVEMYMRKSEELFRKHFTKEADRVLSKIYSNENMNASEKKFISGNNAMRDELLEIQRELAERSGISEEAAGRISMEIIERLTMEKQKQLKYNSN